MQCRLYKITEHDEGFGKFNDFQDIIDTIIAQIAIEFVHIEVPTLSLGAINSTKKVL